LSERGARLARREGRARDACSGSGSEKSPRVALTASAPACRPRVEQDERRARPIDLLKRRSDGQSRGGDTEPQRHRAPAKTQYQCTHRCLTRAPRAARGWRSQPLNLRGDRIRAHRGIRTVCSDLISRQVLWRACGPPRGQEAPTSLTRRALCLGVSVPLRLGRARPCAGAVTQVKGSKAEGCALGRCPGPSTASAFARSDSVVTRAGSRVTTIDGGRTCSPSSSGSAPRY
jgi:hypothetical protein